ncbi:MAG TPA: methionyl-tRNA formyltransferase [archaeon]|nr:methionyl-tRNA formyltransferase [archaeon]
MRIIIIGPTLLTRHCLEAIITEGKDEILAVYVLDDTFAWVKSRFAIMDDTAQKNNINLYKVSNINDRSVIDQIKKFQPDVILELGWSQIISPEILLIPKKGCIGVHASLLPKNRGAASLNWALIKGEKKTGVTLFYLAERPDDGDIIAQKEFAADERDDIETLHAKSDLASVELLMENMGAIRNDTVKRIPQDMKQVTYTPRRKPEDGVISWTRPSIEIYNWVRAQSHPFPGSFTFWKNKKLYVWRVKISEYKSVSRPGEISMIKNKQGVLVNTTDNMILLERVQFDNGIEMWADELARKYNLQDGDFLG